jgi:hypothetical protein
MRQYNPGKDKRMEDYDKARKRTKKAFMKAERKRMLDAGFFDGRFGDRVVKNRKNDREDCRKFRYEDNDF